MGGGKNRRGRGQNKGGAPKPQLPAADEGEPPLPPPHTQTQTQHTHDDDDNDGYDDVRVLQGVGGEATTNTTAAAATAAVVTPPPPPAEEEGEEGEDAAAAAVGPSASASRWRDGGASSVTTIDPEMQRFVEEEDRQLRAHATEGAELQSLADAEASRRVLVRCDEDAGRRAVKAEHHRAREHLLALSEEAAAAALATGAPLHSDDRAVAQQQQQQQQQPRFYGAAALRVESSSEALDYAAAAARTVAQQQQQQEGEGEGEHQRQRQRDAAAAGAAAPSRTTRQTNYGTIPDAEGQRLPSAIAALHHLRSRSGGGGGRHPTASPLAASLSGGGGGGARCRAEERDTRRARTFFWPLVVAPPLSYDAQREAAFYLPFRDTQYYCYSLEEEMAALRAITVDQAVAAAAEGTLCTPVSRDIPRSLAAAPPTRLYDAAGHQHHPLTSSVVEEPFFEGFGHRAGSTSSHSHSAANNMNASFGSSSGRLGGGGGGGGPLLPAALHINGADFTDLCHCRDEAGRPVPSAHRYHVPQLCRLWTTTVLRQTLFIALAALLVLAQSASLVVCGSLLDVYASSSREGFYVSRNRFGASLALSTFEIAAGGAVALALCLATVAAAARFTRQQQQQQQQLDGVDRHRRGSTGSVGTAASSTSTSSVGPPRAFLLLLSPRLLLFCGVAMATAGANLLFFAGTKSRGRVATGAKVLSGAGEGMSLVGLFAIACAEVGITAGATVLMAVFVPMVLLAAAAEYLILPFALDSWVTAAAALHGVTVAQSAALLFAAALIALTPADMLARAAAVNLPYLAPAALVKAAAEVSPRFVCRVLAVAALSAVMLLLGICATPILSQRGADGGRVQTELLPMDPRHAACLMFLAALCVWPFCLVPRTAAIVNRTLPCSVLTVLLAGMWLLYALFDPPSRVGGAADMVAAAETPTTTTASATTSNTAAAAGGGGGGVASSPRAIVPPSTAARLVGAALTPTRCAVVTAVVFAVVTASVLRAIANSGATLPIHPSHSKRRRHRGGGGGGDPSVLSSANADESLSYATTTATTTASAAGGGGDDGALLDDCENIRARFIFQRRGGPSAVLVLVLLLVATCATVCALSLAVASALLTDLYHAPRNPVDIADGVPADMHESLLWVVAGLCGLAAFFELLEAVVVTRANMRRNQLEI